MEAGSKGWKILNLLKQKFAVSFLYRDLCDKGNSLYHPSTGKLMGKGLGRCNFGVFLESLRKEWK
jgi:hypothetical protein